MLSSLKDADAQREIAMGKAVAEAALHRPIRHFAYPFGDRDAFSRQHVTIAQDIGLASAATVLPAVVESKGYSNLHALPRLAWDGRQRSLRMMRVLLSGMYFAQARPKQTNWS